jgi:hypothetical protein
MTDITAPSDTNVSTPSNARQWGQVLRARTTHNYQLKIIISCVTYLARTSS